MIRAAALLLSLILGLAACNQNHSQQTAADHQTTSMTDRPTNRLAQETSPYLLQHQYNPVDWYPWGEEAFAKARAENKPLLISIGYSACHWCHVMEHESFEDDSVAAVMNRDFVCIKVDREERPDVDQIYMNAVQLMTGRGGWPLNCFAMPDGRPIYGGTYFQKDQWLDVLRSLSETWQQEPDKVVDYADRLTAGVQQSDLIEVAEGPTSFSKNTLDETVANWRDRLDYKEGGPDRSPKFPLPNNYLFLLRQATLTDDAELLDQVHLTLRKMAFGGIYDQIGGGFSRYSVDGLWKVPHFEKMLYDNAQLVALYSEAYQASGEELYKHTVYETIEWLEREMMGSKGEFYSALDADSEGEEGKFYVWSEEELRLHTAELFEFVKSYYNVNAKGRWEHGNYILLRDGSLTDYADDNDLTVEQVQEKVAEVKKRLMVVRDERIRPGLDDKVLTSWNALMISGYVQAYQAFGEERFLTAALRTADFIWSEQRRDDGGLNHSYKAGRSTINGYLEDYCFVAEAYTELYQATFDERWLERARELTEYSILHFRDEGNGMIYFTSDVDPPLIARKTEVDDNVIPASNSSMAKVLHTLGTLYHHQEYMDMCDRMLMNMQDKIPAYGGGFSNWAMLLQRQVYPYYEVAILSERPHEQMLELSLHYVPLKLYLGDTDGDSDLPLLEYKHVADETTIYVCVERSCRLPVGTANEALEQMGISGEK